MQKSSWKLFSDVDRHDKVQPVSVADRAQEAGAVFGDGLDEKLFVRDGADCVVNIAGVERYAHRLALESGGDAVVYAAGC